MPSLNKMSEDNIIYFSSDGHLGLGGLDVFYSKTREFLKANFQQNYENVDGTLRFKRRRLVTIL